MLNRRHDLEAAIDADPEDLAGYEVLGDFLLQQGDPRGELMAQQIKGERDHAAMASPIRWSSRGESELEKRFAPRCTDRTELRWRAGYIQHANVAFDEVAQVIDHPSARFLTILTILDTAGSRLPERFALPVFQPMLDHLVSRPRPALRRLQFLIGHNGPRYALGDLGRLWHAVPDLNALSICGAASSTSEIRLPHLEQLSISAIRLSKDLLARIREAQWPALQHLALRGLINGDSFGELRGLFASPSFPELDHLELTHVPSWLDLLLPLLLGSPLLPRLRALRLSSVTDDVAELILRNARALEHLELLLTGHRMTEPMIARLADHGVIVDSTEAPEIW